MLENTNHYETGGSSSFYAFPKNQGNGPEKVVVNAPIPSYGTVVQASLDNADPLVDTSKVDGPMSPLDTIELASAAPTAPGSARTHLYGLSLNTESVAIGERCPVVVRNVTMYARVQVTSADMPALTPLMPDFANDGTLTIWDGTAKPIALLAKAVTGTGGSAEEQLQIVHLDGVTGFGGGYGA